MRVLRNLSWTWRVPACCLALAYALAALAVIVSLLPIGRHVSYAPILIPIKCLLGFFGIWVATVGICSKAGEIRLTRYSDSYGDCWRQSWRVILYGLSIAGLAACVFNFILEDDPTLLSDPAFVITAMIAVPAVLLYAPLMSIFVRRELRRLARDNHECYYCGLDLELHPEHQEASCDSQTKARRRRRRQELAEQRRRCRSQTSLRDSLSRVGWWWYATAMAMVAMMVACFVVADCCEGVFAIIALGVLVGVSLLYVPWLYCVVPFLEAGQSRFATLSECRLNWALTPVGRHKTSTGVMGGVAVFLVVFCAYIISESETSLADDRALTRWFRISALLVALTGVAWFFWATPRLEMRVRRSAWRVLVCYDCGEPLHGVTAANCPECDTALQRPTACPRCRYDIAHIASNACPECGQELLPPLDPAASPEQTRNSASAAASPIANTDA